MCRTITTHAIVFLEGNVGTDRLILLHNDSMAMSMLGHGQFLLQLAET